MNTNSKPSDEMYIFLAADAAVRALWALQAEHVDGTPAHRALDAPLKIAENQRDDALSEATIANVLELARALRNEWYDVDRPICDDTCHEVMPRRAHILMRMLLELAAQREATLTDAKAA